MSTGYQCATCGEWHPELPFSFHAPAPVTWIPELAADPDSELSDDVCIIRREEFYVRGLVRIPLVDDDRTFEWGVWVSVSRESFERIAEVWEVEGRESEPPYFGWLMTELGAAYGESTLQLKANLVTQPVGLRPFVELEPTEHPLAVEQRNGIPLARVQELAELLLHGDSD